MAHRVLIAPREYDPYTDFRQLVWQLRFRLGSPTSLIEEFVGGFADNILFRTFQDWATALGELARIERQAMTLEEWDEMMAVNDDNEEDHADEDFDPTAME